MSFVEGNMSVGIELAPGTLDRLKANLSQLEKGINLKVNLDPAPIAQGTQALNQLNNAAQGASNSIASKLGGAVKQTGVILGSLAAVGGAGLVAIATKAIMAGKEFNILQQQVRASLTAILGTSAAAEGLLKDVNKLNDTSPFPRSAFLSATQQLVGFGVSAQRVVPIIDAVQNAVAGIGGNSNDIAMFTRAFAQIQSQGKLTGDVLFSLGEKGIDAAAIIGKSMGKSGQQIKAEISAGTLSADASIDALTKGLKEKFAGAVDNVAKSYNGALDRVHARLRDIGAAITSAFINPMGGGAAVDALNNVASALANIRDNVIKPLLPMFQRLGNMLIDASQAFLKFTNSIKADQVLKFIGIFQTALPVIAIFGAKLIASLTSTLPIISKLTGALGGPVAAIVLIVATVPQLRAAFMSLVSALSPLVTALLPALKDSLGIIQGLFIAVSPILGVVVGLVRAFAAVVTPLVNALQGLGILAPIIALIAAKFALAKVTGSGMFQSLAGMATGFIANLRAVGLTTGSIGERFGQLRAAGANALQSVAASIDPVQVALVGVTFIITDVINMFEKAKQKGHEAATAISKGLDFNVPTDQGAGIDAITLEMDRLKKEIGKGINWGNVFDNGKSVFQQKAAISGLKTEYKDLGNQLKAVGEVQDKQTSLGAGVLQLIQDIPDLSKQFTNVGDVIKFALANGVDFSNLRWDKINSSTADLVAKMKELPVPIDEATKKMDAFRVQVDALDKIRAAADQLKASEKALADLRKTTAQELKDNVTKAEVTLADVRRGATAAADAVTKAEIGLDQARRSVTDTQFKLNELEKQRSRLLADTGKSAREVADAEATLARTGAELRDQDERRVEIQRDLANLARDTPDKLAAGDRSIERAKIALNTATREQLLLEEQLHKTQIANVDLSGLTPAQIKQKLAQVRTQIDAQRRATGTLKTQQQIADEEQTAALNKSDAEQGLKDSIQSRADLELSLNTQKREDEQALQALQLDHESSLRRQFEQQQQLTILRSGDTETARTLRDLNTEIAGTTDTLKTAVIGVRDADEQVRLSREHQANYAITIRDAERDVATNIAAIKEHSDNIQKAQTQIKDDSIKYRDAVATAKSDTKATNDLLFERLGLNAKLLAQNPDLLKKQANDLLANIKEGTPGVETHIQKQDRLRGPLMDIMLNHPDQLLEFLRRNGFGFADGGVVNSETFARIGEAGREVVLPLTRPARMADLLGDSQVLNPVLAALGRISLPRTRSPITSTSSPISSISGSGSNVVVRREDGPMTYGQAREIIALLESNGKTQLKIEAPITIHKDVDEAELLRTVSRQLERKVEDIMNKRRGR